MAPTHIGTIESAEDRTLRAVTAWVRSHRNESLALQLVDLEDWVKEFAAFFEKDRPEFPSPVDLSMLAARALAACARIVHRKEQEAAIYRGQQHPVEMFRPAQDVPPPPPPRDPLIVSPSGLPHPPGSGRVEVVAELHRRQAVANAEAMRAHRHEVAEFQQQEDDTQIERQRVERSQRAKEAWAKKKRVAADARARAAARPQRIEYPQSPWDRPDFLLGTWDGADGEYIDWELVRLYWDDQVPGMGEGRFREELNARR